jgi:hypothetical protein
VRACGAVSRKAKGGRAGTGLPASDRYEKPREKLI